MVSFHPQITLGLVGGVAAVSLFLAVMALRARQRTGHRNLLYVASAFSLFFVKSLVTAYALYIDPSQYSDPDPRFWLTHGHLEFVGSALDLAIVLLLVAPFFPFARRKA